MENRKILYTDKISVVDNPFPEVIQSFQWNSGSIDTTGVLSHGVYGDLNYPYMFDVPTVTKKGTRLFSEISTKLNTNKLILSKTLLDKYDVYKSPGFENNYYGDYDFTLAYNPLGFKFRQDFIGKLYDNIQGNSYVISEKNSSSSFDDFNDIKFIQSYYIEKTDHLRVIEDGELRKLKSDELINEADLIIDNSNQSRYILGSNKSKDFKNNIVEKTDDIKGLYNSADDLHKSIFINKVSNKTTTINPKSKSKFTSNIKFREPEYELSSRKSLYKTIKIKRSEYKDNGHKLTENDIELLKYVKRREDLEVYVFMGSDTGNPHNDDLKGMKIGFYQQLKYESPDPQEELIYTIDFTTDGVEFILHEDKKHLFGYNATHNIYSRDEITIEFILLPVNKRVNVLSFKSSGGYVYFDINNILYHRGINNFDIDLSKMEIDVYVKMRQNDKYFGKLGKDGQGWNYSINDTAKEWKILELYLPSYFGGVYGEIILRDNFDTDKVDEGNYAEHVNTAELNYAENGMIIAYESSNGLDKTLIFNKPSKYKRNSANRDYPYDPLNMFSYRSNHKGNITDPYTSLDPIWEFEVTDPNDPFFLSKLSQLMTVNSIYLPIKSDHVKINPDEIYLEVEDGKLHIMGNDLQDQLIPEALNYLQGVRENLTTLLYDDNVEVEKTLQTYKFGIRDIVTPDDIETVTDGNVFNGDLRFKVAETTKVAQHLSRLDKNEGYLCHVKGYNKTPMYVKLTLFNEVPPQWTGNPTWDEYNIKLVIIPEDAIHFDKHLIEYQEVDIRLNNKEYIFIPMATGKLILADVYLKSVGLHEFTEIMTHDKLDFKLEVIYSE